MIRLQVHTDTMQCENIQELQGKESSQRVMRNLFIMTSSSKCEMIIKKGSKCSLHLYKVVVVYML